MPLPIVQSRRYDAEFPVDHRFPMAKYSRLAEILTAEGLPGREGFHVPEPATAQWLSLAHDPAYVDQVIAAAVPHKIEREIGFPVTEKVALRARSASAGTVMAGLLALRHGVACNAAGGSHHARREHGAGFCTFNDVAVAARVLQTGGEIARALVIDLDVHQGDGTADIFEHDPTVFTVSVHAGRNYPARKKRSDMDIELPDGVRDDAYLETVEDMLPRALAAFPPDIVFYNAGVDPHHDDRLGHLALTDKGLERRERAVFAFFRERHIPVCGVIGGGYSRDIDALANRHAILFRVASEFV